MQPCGGPVQRPQGKILLHAVADSPADDSSREKVNDEGKTNPTFPRPDIGDVARPLLVRPARREVLLQEIRRDVEGMIAVGGRLELAGPNNLDAIWRISRATRRWPTCRPNSFNFPNMRGLP